MKSLHIVLIFKLIAIIICANHYTVTYSFDESLKDWRAQLEKHDRMPATYVRFLAFKKIIRDFNPIQDEMLLTSLEAEKENDQGIKEHVIHLSSEANREIEKRLIVHKPFLEAIKKAN